MLFLFMYLYLQNKNNLFWKVWESQVTETSPLDVFWFIVTCLKKILNASHVIIIKKGNEISIQKQF